MSESVSIKLTSILGQVELMSDLVKVQGHTTILGQVELVSESVSIKHTSICTIFCK